MNRKKCTGQTCVGDLRLAPLDVGFDLRLTGVQVKLPDVFRSVGLDIDGETWLVSGTRDEMVQAILDAGYSIRRE